MYAIGIDRRTRTTYTLGLIDFTDMSTNTNNM